MLWLNFEYDGKKWEGLYVSAELNKKKRVYIRMRVVDLDVKELVPRSFFPEKMLNIVSTEK